MGYYDNTEIGRRNQNTPSTKDEKQDTLPSIKTVYTSSKDIIKFFVYTWLFLFTLTFTFGLLAKTVAKLYEVETHNTLLLTWRFFFSTIKEASLYASVLFLIVVTCTVMVYPIFKLMLSLFETQFENTKEKK